MDCLGSGATAGGKRVGGGVQTWKLGLRTKSNAREGSNGRQNAASTSKIWDLEDETNQAKIRRYSITAKSNQSKKSCRVFSKTAKINALCKGQVRSGERGREVGGRWRRGRRASRGI